MTTEIFDLSSFGCCVYHCVDEIKAQPGMPAALLEDMEERLSRQTDVIFATSPQLAESRRTWNANTHYLPNVADYEHFSTALTPQAEVPQDLLSIPSPRLGFIGAISGYKLDFRLIRRIAESRPKWSVVLIGQVGEGDPSTDSSLLNGLPNLHLMGPRPYRELPGYLKGLDVAMLPNNINDYTDAMFPMKFFEYLAAGCPVVSANLRAIREFSEAVTIADSPDDFIAAIERVLSGDVSSLEDRLNLARKYTYEKRTQRMLKLVEEVCAR